MSFTAWWHALAFPVGFFCGGLYGLWRNRQMVKLVRKSVAEMRAILAEKRRIDDRS